MDHNAYMLSLLEAKEGLDKTNHEDELVVVDMHHQLAASLFVDLCSSVGFHSGESTLGVAFYRHDSYFAAVVLQLHSILVVSSSSPSCPATPSHFGQDASR
jgi:hypothetical protein